MNSAIADRTNSNNYSYESKYKANYHSDIYNEGISEPIKIPNNVQGGTGIVGVSIESNVLLHIPDL